MDDQLQLIPHQVFISYSKEDSSKAQSFYTFLKSEGIYAWIDTAELNPGENWDLGIKRAMRACPYIIVLLSANSVSKKGYIQKEIKEALDIAETVPDDQIFIIPVRLEKCSIPERLQKWQYTDLFVEQGKQKLIQFLKSKLGIAGLPLLQGQERELRATLTMDLIVDSFLVRKFLTTNRAIRSRSRSRILYISDGICLEARIKNTKFLQLFDEVFPNCEKQQDNFFQRIIPSQQSYKIKNNEIKAIHIPENYAAYHRVLEAFGGHLCGIGNDYLNYINVKYPNGNIYIRDSENPIIVEDDGEIRFLVMPYRI